LSTVDELQDGAVRLRAEVRRLTDVRERLSQAKAHRTWAGPASIRFAHSIDRRLREIDEQRDLLDLLARRLDDAAGQEAATHAAGTHAAGTHSAHHGRGGSGHPVSGGVAVAAPGGVSGGGEA
jgi:uncharacterized protein YukE